MKKTVQVNIGGCAFSVDEDSYRIIDEYLSALRKYYKDNPDSEEIVSDIEERLADLLAERCGSGSVVSAPDVRHVTSILGTPSSLSEDSGPGAPGATKSPRRLYRNPEGKILGGVCSGIATYLNWDVTLVRLIAAIAFLATFAVDNLLWVMPMLYLIAWIAMPNADTVQKQCELRGERLSAAGIGEQYSGGKPAESQPAGRVLGRVLGVILGIMLFLSGLCGVAAGIFACLTPALTNLNPDWAEAVSEALTDIGLTNLGSLGVSTLIFLAIVYFIPCIIAIYYSILLIFGLGSPKWRPGLILICIWFVSLVVLAVLVGIDIVKIIPLID